MRIGMKRKLSFIMLLPAITFGAQSVLAENGQGFSLEEIVVTATKRETSEMETPLSLEAVSGDDLVQNNIVNLADLTNSIPSVTIGEGLTAGSINVRGMGSGQERGLEQSVAMFIDDIYMPRSRQYRAPFFDAERVEVMRGPQAVLFGLNATAGTIQIYSASTEPGDETHVSLSAGYEMENDSRRTDIVLGGSFGESVGVRLAVRYNETGDYIRNEFNGEDHGGKRETVTRGTIVWDVSDGLRITSKLNYAESDQEIFMGEGYGAAYSAFAVPDTQLNWRNNVDPAQTAAFGDRDPGFYSDLFSVSVKADLAIGDHELSIIGAHSESDFLQLVTTATVPLNFFGNSLLEEYKQDSLEIRWSSPVDGDFSFITGLYISDSELFNIIRSKVGGDFLAAAISPGLAAFDTVTAPQQATLETLNVSPYISATFNLSDELRIIAGLRYSYTDKDYTRANDFSQCVVLPAGTSTSLGSVQAFFDAALGAPFGSVLQGALCGSGDNRESSVFENVMPEVIAQWDFAEDAVAYLKLGESAKSGTYQLSDLVKDSAEVDDETARSIEVGVKSRLMDGRIELNAAVFRTEYEDLQLNSFTPVPGGTPRATTQNAGASTSQGIEVEVNFAATEWLKIGGNVGYLDSSYDDFKTGVCAAGEVPGPDGISCDKSGEDTPFAPEVSGAVYADMEFSLWESVLLTGGVDIAFSSSYHTSGNLDPSADQDSYERYGARIGLRAEDDSWQISLVGKNLSDEAVVTFTETAFGFNQGYLGASRTVTIQGTYNF